MPFRVIKTGAYTYNNNMTTILAAAKRLYYADHTDAPEMGIGR